MTSPLPAGGLGCHSCGRPYSKGPDLVVSDENWAKIEPPQGGFLCPNCMNDAFEALGAPYGSIEAAFTSGPFANLNWKKPTAAQQPSDLVKRLREEAKKATPGPWYVKELGTDRTYYSVEWTPSLKICRTYGNSLADEENADYISAANPVVILSLLDRIEALEAAELEQEQSDQAEQQRTDNGQFGARIALEAAAAQSSVRPSPLKATVGDGSNGPQKPAADLASLRGVATHSLGFASFKDGTMELIIQDLERGTEVTISKKLDLGEQEKIGDVLPTCVFANAAAQPSREAALVKAAQRLIKNDDEERRILEPSCQECTGWNTPKNHDKGPCDWHKFLAAVTAYDTKPDAGREQECTCEQIVGERPYDSPEYETNPNCPLHGRALDTPAKPDAGRP